MLCGLQPCRGDKHDLSPYSPLPKNVNKHQREDRLGRSNKSDFFATQRVQIYWFPISKLRHFYNSGKATSKLQTSLRNSIERAQIALSSNTGVMRRVYLAGAAVKRKHVYLHNTLARSTPGSGSALGCVEASGKKKN